jgi:small-conductance mechanosensitive channel
MFIKTGFIGMKHEKLQIWLPLFVFFAVAAALFLADFSIGGPVTTSGMTVYRLIAFIVLTLGLASLASLISYQYLKSRGKSLSEWMMISKLYWLMGIFVGLLIMFYGLGLLSKITTLLSLFGGMVIGWSLQQPLSGLVAWVLVNLRRPFCPGDRIQFPKLELTGDIKNIGAMYMELNEVGGTIASEEAVGRSIFIPNAMLFDQVVINYATINDAPYILDEIVVRITYDSKWEVAEKILIDAATTVTKDVIEATGITPYIRSELYDYGVYMQLRYQTRAKDRPITSYKITKLIFEEIQHNPLVDVAIPYIYSYRAAMAGTDEPEYELNREPRGEPSPLFSSDKLTRNVQEIDISQIEHGQLEDTYDIEQLAGSIQSNGLLRPVVLKENPQTGRYEILAGKGRLQACKKLGWKTIPALVLAGPGNHIGDRKP